MMASEWSNSIADSMDIAAVCGDGGAEEGGEE